VTPRLFPILYPSHELKDDVSRLCRAGHAFLLTGFPWDLLAAHEEQAIKNHGQSLARLAERGGLDPEEMLAVMQDRGVRWHGLSVVEAQTELLKILVRSGMVPSIFSPA